MRRIKLVLAALAVMVASFVTMSSPATADDWNDWNNNCSWDCNGWNNNWGGNDNWNTNWWNNGWNNPWWWNNDFNNCLFLPALTIC